MMVRTSVYSFGGVWKKKEESDMNLLNDVFSILLATVQGALEVFNLLQSQLAG